MIAEGENSAEDKINDNAVDKLLPRNFRITRVFSDIAHTSRHLPFYFAEYINENNPNKM